MADHVRGSCSASSDDLKKKKRGLSELDAADIGCRTRSRACRPPAARAPPSCRAAADQHLDRAPHEGREVEARRREGK